MFHNGVEFLIGALLLAGPRYCITLCYVIFCAVRCSRRQDDHTNTINNTNKKEYQTIKQRNKTKTPNEGKNKIKHTR